MSFHSAAQLQHLGPFGTPGHAKGSGTKFKFRQPSNRKSDDIWKACTRGDLSAVRQHLRDGVDVNQENIRTSQIQLSTPLFCAATNSHFNICKLLIEEGAEVCTYSRKGEQSILHVAAGKNDIEFVEYLVRLKPDHLDIRQRDRDSRTALDWAVSAKATLVIDLLQREYEIEQVPESLREAATKGDAAKVKLLLAIENTIPTEPDSFQQTALHLAASAAVAILLLETGKFDVNQRDYIRRSPLSYTVTSGKTEVIALLLKHHAEVDSMDNCMRTPLIYAIKGFWNQTAETLLQHGANADSIDAD